MRTSILFVLILIPLLSFSQYDSCEEAEANLTCGLDIEVFGVIEDFETSVVGFIATDSQAYVSLFWECVDEPEIGQFLDVYSILRDGCQGSVLEGSPGCDIGPIGESEYVYEGLTIGETYFLSFESCEGFPCDFEGFLQMEFSGEEILELNFVTPVFADGCFDPELESNEFCIDKEIVFSTNFEEFYPQQIWTVTAISGNTNVDGVIWSDQYGNIGEGSVFEKFDSNTEALIVFDDAGLYEVCIESIQSSCEISEPICLDISITESFRFFETEICLMLAWVEGLTPNANDEGYEWISGPIFFGDMTENSGFLEREIYSEYCECYYYEAIEYDLYYPGEEGCFDQSLNSCPNWDLTLNVDGVSMPSAQAEITEESVVSIQVDPDYYSIYSDMVWYRSSDSEFVPGLDGIEIGRSAIEPRYTNFDCKEDIELLAIQYDGYRQFVPRDSMTLEKEMLIFYSGFGFNIESLEIETVNCIEGCPGQVCKWNGDIADNFQNCEKVIGVGDGDVIPPNSIFIVYFGPEEPNVKWNVELLCGQTSCIYVTRSECKSYLEYHPGEGFFPNDDGLHDILVKTDCGESLFEYEAKGNFGQGSYVTQEKWTNNLQEDEIPTVFFNSPYGNEYWGGNKSKVQSLEIQFDCLSAPVGGQGTGSADQVFYVKGVVGGLSDNTCCDWVSPTLTFTLQGCELGGAPTLAWGANSAAFLPTDFTIRTADCPYIPPSNGFQNQEMTQLWSFDDILALTSCADPVIRYQNDFGPDAFEEGSHKLSYEAQDNCGNILRHEFILTVECVTDTGTNPKIFAENPWLLDHVDPADCSGTTIETYTSGIYSFYYVNDGNEGILYFQDGTRYCADAPGFSCVEAYGLGTATAVWECDDSGGGGGGPSPLDEYPWLSDYIDFDDCLGVQIEFYDFYGSVFSYFEANGKWTLFSDMGQVYCTDNPPSFYCPEVYGLGAPISVWECGQDCICPTEYDPVCGEDGLTYNNSCEAACAGVMVESTGECDTENLPLLFEEYPWLIDIVNPVDCSEFSSVTLLQLGSYKYLFYEQAGLGTLYNAQGQLYCQDYSNFSCLDAYGFTQDDVLDVWTCDGFKSEDLESRKQKFGAGNIDQDLSCYPNPTTGILHAVIRNENELGIIRLMNMAGYTLSARELSGNEKEKFDLQSYESGIYFIELLTKSQRIIKKIVLI